MTPERIARLKAVLDRRQPDLTVVTDFVHKQRNTSAIVRNADAVGIMAIHAVVNKRDYKAFRGTAMGSHPRVRQFCIDRGLAYPALDEEGEIADPPVWYAQARELLAQREES